MAQNPSSPVKPVVIGIYGLPGSGKTTLLNQLRMALGEDHFMYFEGSDEIGKLVCGGITSFTMLDDKARHDFRELAISCIKNNCIAHDKTGVFTGHFMFWNEGKKSGPAVYTQSDLDTYTHILYLDVPPQEIVKRRLDDSGRNRSHVSTNHVQRWVEAEKQMLRDLCYRNNILFCAVTSNMIPKEVERLLYIPAIKSGTLGRMIGLDADRTLTSQDTGDLFWEKISPLLEYAGGERPKTPAQVVFESPLGYSYDAFRYGFVVTAEVKGALAGHLKDKHHLEFCAFGDSPLDLEMLSRADKAIVVVGDEASRSVSMETALKKAIENDGLKAKQ
ncbi:hypothetical protein CA14_009809 [Aspergillus flavus]|uniref:P-loop containing nucleoside triphosphate hydrolase protein n=1 Tax=Aspergillus flavus TaxID=5059 RepID=A0AB74BSB2_ASPFL|nr:hypothetical protein CA14_009809 [Aspergillus flavus]